MAGYQTIEALRPILHKGPPATPVLDRLLFYKPRYQSSPKLHHVQRMIELRKQGVSTQKISELTGFGRTCVRRVTRDVPAPANGWGNGAKPSSYNREKAQRMRRAGFTVTEVAEDLRCCRSTVHKIVTGYQRKHLRKPPSEICRVIRSIRTLTGITSGQLRHTDERGAKVALDIAKARHILFWVAVRRLGMKQVDVAAALDGYHVKTISRGVAAAGNVADKLTIPESAPFGIVVRMLWQAEWPKASA